MNTKESIQTRLDFVRQKYGDWTFDIPLPHDIWTGGNLQIPHTRLKRIVQVVSDLTQKSLSQCRILDLGCLDGIFSIEFASHGSSTVGVEIRETNIEKAIFCKEILGLDNLEFRHDDVRNISVEAYGRFDAIVCSGILYHLPAGDVITLINKMYEIVDRVVVIDTHIALEAIERFDYNDKVYWGKVYREHPDDSTEDEKAKRLWASADNPTSFWFTRASLVNILREAGFSSVYECFTPAHLNFGEPGIEHQDRCTFVAIKDDKCNLVTSPTANSLAEDFPENSLQYTPGTKTHDSTPPLYRRLISRVKRLFKK